MSVKASSARRNAGDTIVEVLIAMAVAVAVIGGSYRVVNHTLANSQQAQEHSEALKIAEGQLEHLKAATSDPSSADYAELLSSPNHMHCFGKTNGTLTKFVLPVSLATQKASPTPQNYPAECKDWPSVNYRVGVEYKPGSAGNKLDDVFEVAVDWDGATGGYDHVSLVYKVFQR